MIDPNAVSPSVLRGSEKDVQEGAPIHVCSRLEPSKILDAQMARPRTLQNLRTDVSHCVEEQQSLLLISCHKLTYTYCHIVHEKRKTYLNKRIHCIFSFAFRFVFPWLVFSLGSNNLGLLVEFPHLFSAFEAAEISY